MSKQKVFSHTNDINYNDYIKNKNGTEILKTLKKSNHDLEDDNNSMELKQFKNYNDFLTLTKSYYDCLQFDECQKEATTNIYESNDSFVEKSEEEEEENNNQICKEENNVLYPYGHYNKQKKAEFLYPYKIDITKWCEKRNVCITYLPENNDVCPPRPSSPENEKIPNIPHPHPHPHPQPNPQPNPQQNPPPHPYPHQLPYIPYPIPQQAPSYIPYPIPYPFPQSNIHNLTCNPFIQSPNKCKTVLCKKGLCNNCNNKDKTNDCKCNNKNENQHFYQQQTPYSFMNPMSVTNNGSNKQLRNVKQLKTGFSF